MKRLTLVGGLVTFALFAGHWLAAADDEAGNPPRSPRPLPALFSGEQRLTTMLLEKVLQEGDQENVVCCPSGAYATLAVLEAGCGPGFVGQVRRAMGLNLETEGLAEQLAILAQKGHPTDFVLGVSINENDGYGVKLSQAETNGPAAKSGLAQGDLIFSVDDEPVRNTRQFLKLLDESTGVVRLSGFGWESGREFADKTVVLSRRHRVDVELRGRLVRSAIVVCLRKDLTSTSPYPAVVERLYSAKSIAADFSKPKPLVRDVANWLESQLGVRPNPGSLAESFSPGTALWVVNAVTFDGKWSRKFKLIRDEPIPMFQGPNGPQRAEFMRATLSQAQYANCNDRGFSVVDLPYDHSGLVMRVVLPETADGWKKLRPHDWLDSQAAAAIQAKSRKLAVEVLLPRFAFETTTSLNGLLEKLGLEAMLGMKADFSRITDGERLFLSDFRQQSTIAVDEAGTRAGAVTQATIVTSAVAPKTVPFHVTHPFFFAIVDQESGAVFFAGRVTSPVSK